MEASKGNLHLGELTDNNGTVWVVLAVPEEYEKKDSLQRAVCAISEKSKFDELDELNARKLIVAWNNFGELLDLFKDAIDGLGFTPTKYEELLKRIENDRII